MLFALFFLISVSLFAFVLSEVVTGAAMFFRFRKLAAFFRDGLTPATLARLDYDRDGSVRPPPLPLISIRASCACVVVRLLCALLCAPFVCPARCTMPP